MSIKKEVADKLVFLVTGAFGFVAALAWNDAVKSLFAEGGLLHLMSAGGIWIYAVVITFIAVFVTIWVSRVASRVK